MDKVSVTICKRLHTNHILSQSIQRVKAIKEKEGKSFVPGLARVVDIVMPIIIFIMDCFNVLT